MKNLTRRQRQALIILGIANLAALCALGTLLIKGFTPSNETVPTSPISPDLQGDCRRAISAALLNTGHSGMIQTQANGTIHIRLQRPSLADDIRLDADAGIWTALEAVGGLSTCRVFSTIDVIVELDQFQSLKNPNTVEAVWASAHVDMFDLALWSSGTLNDAELSDRIEYRHPFTQSFTIQRTTVSP